MPPRLRYSGWLLQRLSESPRSAVECRLFIGAVERCRARIGSAHHGRGTNFENLQRRTGRFGCIVRVPPAHFVILSEISGEKAIIVDPPHEYSLPLATFGVQWDGTALLISPQPLVPEEDLLGRGFGLLFWASFCTLAVSLILGAALCLRRFRRSFVASSPSRR